MNKHELARRTDEVINGTKEALTLIYGELNNGQRKKLLKNGRIKELLLRYEVITEE